MDSVKDCYNALQENLAQYLHMQKEEVFIMMDIHAGYFNYVFTKDELEIKLVMSLLVKNEEIHECSVIIVQAALTDAIITFVEQFKKFGFNIRIDTKDYDVRKFLTVDDQDRKDVIFKLFPDYNLIFSNVIQFSTDPTFRRAIFVNSNSVIDFIEKNPDIKHDILLKISYSSEYNIRDLSFDYCYNQNYELIEYLNRQNIAHSVLHYNGNNLGHFFKLYQLAMYINSPSVWGWFLSGHKLYDPRLLLWIAAFAMPSEEIIKKPRMEIIKQPRMEIIELTDDELESD